MKLFIAEVMLPVYFTREFTALIPDQRMKLAELMLKKIILSYTLNAERTRLWIVVSGKTEQDARENLQQLPLDRYYHYTLQTLMFHEMAVPQFPILSLN